MAKAPKADSFRDRLLNWLDANPSAEFTPKEAAERFKVNPSHIRLKLKDMRIRREITVIERRARNVPVYMRAGSTRVRQLIVVPKRVEPLTGPDNGRSLALAWK